MAVLTFTAACTGCGACLLTCPTHAIRPVGGRLTVIDERCTGCGECVEICPADAIAPHPDLVRLTSEIRRQTHKIARNARGAAS